MTDEEKQIIEWFKRTYPERAKIIEARKEERKTKRYSRFDFMTPEEYQFWVDEHQ